MNAFGAQSVVTKPPEKGSFPLDKKGDCKAQKETFMKCLRDRSGNHYECKHLSRQYLECRMEKGLMQKENLDLLGLEATTPQERPIPQTNEGRKEAEGFIAGTGAKKSRFSN